MGLTDNIRDFFRQQGDQQTKGYGNFPNNQVVFPFNSDIGFFSGVDQVSPEGNSAALAPVPGRSAKTRPRLTGHVRIFRWCPQQYWDRSEFGGVGVLF